MKLVLVFASFLTLPLWAQQEAPIITDRQEIEELKKVNFYDTANAPTAAEGRNLLTTIANLWYITQARLGYGEAPKPLFQYAEMPINTKHARPLVILDSASYNKQMAERDLIQARDSAGESRAMLSEVYPEYDETRKIRTAYSKYFEQDGKIMTSKGEPAILAANYLHKGKFYIVKIPAHMIEEAHLQVQSMEKEGNKELDRSERMKLDNRDAKHGQVRLQFAKGHGIEIMGEQNSIEDMEKALAELEANEDTKKQKGLKLFLKKARDSWLIRNVLISYEAVPTIAALEKGEGYSKQGGLTGQFPGVFRVQSFRWAWVFNFLKKFRVHHEAKIELDTLSDAKNKFLSSILGESYFYNSHKTGYNWYHLVTSSCVACVVDPIKFLFNSVRVADTNNDGRINTQTEAIRYVKDSIARWRTIIKAIMPSAVLSVFEDLGIAKKTQVVHTNQDLMRMMHPHKCRAQL